MYFYSGSTLLYFVWIATSWNKSTYCPHDFIVFTSLDNAYKSKNNKISNAVLIKFSFKLTIAKNVKPQKETGYHATMRVCDTEEGKCKKILKLYKCN